MFVHIFISLSLSLSLSLSTYIYIYIYIRCTISAKGDLSLEHFPNKLDSYVPAMGNSRKLRSLIADGWVLGVQNLLQKFIVQVLRLTCSYLGCERNWSSFESVISLFLKFLFIYFYSNIREFPFHLNT